MNYTMAFYFETLLREGFFDIDNINAELEVNFGHWIGYKVNGKD